MLTTALAAGLVTGLVWGPLLGGDKILQAQTTARTEAETTMEAQGGAGLPNPGFEGGVDANGLPQGWPSLFGATKWGTHLTLSKEMVWEGEWSLRLDDPQTDLGLGLRSAMIPVQPGHQYRVSVHVFNVRTATGSVYLEFWDEKGNRIFNTFRWQPGTKDEWSEIVVEGVAPKDARSATVLLYSSGPARGVVFFDDVRFEDLTATAASAAAAAFPAGAAIAPAQGGAAGVAALQAPVLAPEPWPEHRVLLGHPLKALTMRKVVLGPGPANGGPARAIYAAIPAEDGRPVLAIVDAACGKLWRTLEVPAAFGQAWAATFGLEGALYFSLDGQWFRVDLNRPAELLQVEALGHPVPGESIIWSLATAADGTIYGGTYPGGKVFAYDPVSRKVRDLGPAEPGEAYARHVAAGGEWVFVSTGSQHADLIALNPRTGERRSLLPDPYRVTGIMGELSVAGERLFAAVSGGTVLVYDIRTLSLLKTLSGINSPLPSFVLPGTDLAPVSHNGSLYAYDLIKDELMPYSSGIMGFVPSGMTAWGLAEIDPDTIPENRRSLFQEQPLALVGMTGGLDFWAFNLTQKQPWMGKVELPKGPVRINSLSGNLRWRSDGRLVEGDLVAGGGISPGGLFVLDTATGTIETVERTGQIDSLAILSSPSTGTRVYFGVYPGARIFYYQYRDEAASAPAPARLGAGGEASSAEATGAKAREITLVAGDAARMTQVGSIPDQDRPVAMIAFAGKVYIGTVPVYGRRGGALAEFDPETNQLISFSNIVPEHSVVALAAPPEDSGQTWIYGATSVTGGLGIEKARGWARLFVWDTKTRQKVREITPLPGEEAIGALLVAPDGLVWGSSPHYVFAYDPIADRVVIRVRVLPDSVAQYGWRESFMTIGPDGKIYGTSSNRVSFRVDPVTHEVVLLAGSYNRIAGARDGRLYATTGGSELFALKTNPPGSS
ncbi:MAG: hypothetical protein IMX00_01340 [Limnochordales bacterium]|nr:hypothetical protein [Limnochordales bacterium]